MRTHFTFKTSAFPPIPGEEEELVNDWMYGKALSLHLKEQLEAHGYTIKMQCAEDWGWYTEIENPRFRLSIGCGTHDWESREFVCFVDPSKPTVRKLFKKVSTVETVEKLVYALQEILGGDDRIEDLKLTEA